MTTPEHTPPMQTTAHVTIGTAKKLENLLIAIESINRSLVQEERYSSASALNNAAHFIREAQGRYKKVGR